MNQSWVIPLIIVIVLGVFAVCCVCLVTGVGITSLIPWFQEVQVDQPFEFSTGDPTGTPYVIRPTLPAKATESSSELPTEQPTSPATQVTQEASPEPTSGAGAQHDQPVFYVSQETLKTLEETIIPERDPFDLAQRLQGISGVPETLTPPSSPFTIGSRKQFWVTNTSTNDTFQVNAELAYETDHVYFWVENGVQYNRTDLKNLVDTFEEEIYPTNREFFGSEWTPGIDGDPHLFILYARGLGGSVVGYYSSSDQYPPAISDYSNGHEMFLLSADLAELDDEFTYGVLAHEFQHMIHWYRDMNEETWVNEGFSELASFLNGYGVGGHDYSFIFHPDLQLNYWPTENTGPHYGAAFLFVNYFLNRFGDEATKAVVAHPENGMVSFDTVLQEMKVEDPLTGRPVTADDVFMDWTLASYLLDGQVSDGRYTYANYPGAPQASDTEEISCPSGPLTRDVSQYAADYIRIRCNRAATLTFEGTIQVGVLPENAYSGDYSFWSNMGDESDMTLTRTFDFRDQTGPVTLNYQTWYDLEEDYDYLYVLASTDGQSWEILQTPSGTAEDPSGNSFGWAYNGMSGGGSRARWIEETIDLSQYAGQEVQVRFEYVTDAAVNGEGLLLDDVAVPEINYFTDFETDQGGWEANGFVRIQNVLPQKFRLALIYNGRQPRVEYLTVSADNAIEIPLQLGQDTSEVTLVVTGVTRFTRQKAAYRFAVQP